MVYKSTLEGGSVRSSLSGIQDQQTDYQPSLLPLKLEHKLKAAWGYGSTGYVEREKKKRYACLQADVLSYVGVTRIKCCEEADSEVMDECVQNTHT